MVAVGRVGRAGWFITTPRAGHSSTQWAFSNVYWINECVYALKVSKHHIHYKCQMCLSWFECRSSPPQVHGRRTQLEEVGPWGWSWWVAGLPGFQPKFSASWSRVYPPATAKSRVGLPGSPPWAATHEPKSGIFKLLLGISSRQLEKKIINPMFYIVFHILFYVLVFIWQLWHTGVPRYKVTYSRFVLESGNHWTESHTARVSRGKVSLPTQEMPALHSLASSYMPINDKQDFASW